MSLRFRVVLACVLAAPLLAAIAFGAVQALQPHANAPQEWTPPSNPARVTYNHFCQLFGSGDLLVVGWPDCTIDDPRLERFAQSVRDDAALHDPKSPLIATVLGGSEAVAELSESLGLSREEAAARLRGVIVGPDGRASFAVLGFTRQGLEERDFVFAEVRRLLTEVGVSPSEAKLAGPMANGQAIDEASATSLQTFAPFAAVLLLFLCWVCLRSIRSTLAVFGLSAFGVASTLAILYYRGDRLDAPLIVLPPLILILGASNGMHVTNYYFDAVRAGGRVGAARRTMQTALFPCLLSSLTTIAGFASLMWSNLPPIYAFGAYSSIGVAFAFFLFLFVLPNLLAALDVPVPPEEATLSFWTGFSKVVRFARYPIIVVGLTMLVLGAWGTQYIRTSVHITSFFPAGSKLLQDDAWLEDQIAPMATLECLATFAPDCPLKPSERVELMRRLSGVLQGLPHVGGVISTATFLPELSDANDVRSLIARRSFDRGLAKRLDAVESTDYFRRDRGGEVWRATARVSETGVNDHGAFLDEAQSKLEAAAGPALGQGVTLACTGSTPLIHAVQHELFNALWGSFLSAFGMVALMIAQRGAMRGVVAMIPNLFPIAVVFGALGWWGSPIDVGSVMTASVALGVAVDDTLHFLSFFGRKLDEGEEAPDAVREAYCLCGSAMSMTTLICCLGLSVFVFSSFLPTSRFVWMMSALLFAGLVGDLVLLPAMLFALSNWLYLPKRPQAAVEQTAEATPGPPAPHVAPGGLATRTDGEPDGLSAAVGRT